MPPRRSTRSAAAAAVAEDGGRDEPAAPPAAVEAPALADAPAVDADLPAPAPAGEENGDVDVDDGDDDMSTSSSDDDDDDLDDPLANVSDADAAELERLEAELADNPASYDAHVALIALSRRTGLAARAAAAREAMRGIYPLAPHLWADWLDDEGRAYTKAVEAAGGDAAAPGPAAARARWEALASAATADYLDPALWKVRLDFTLANDPDCAAFTPPGLDKARALIGAALAAGGLVPDGGGAALWAAALAYETAALEAGCGGETQAERVRALWHRRLRTPLPDGEEALAEYERWEAGQGGGGPAALPPHLAADCAAARATGAERAAHEAALAAARTRDGGSPGPALLAAHLAAIKAEEGDADPPRVQVAYERAVTDFPLTVALWARYGRYVEAALPASPAVAADVYGRAVRNCPWSGLLWARAVSAAERRAGRASGGGGAPADPAALSEVDSLSVQALSAGLPTPEDVLEVAFARCDAHRRTAVEAKQRGAPTAGAAAAALRAALDESDAALAAVAPPGWSDPAVSWPAYRAASALAVDGVDGAVAAWEAALKGGVVARQPAAYASAGSALAAAGALDAARSIFKRGLARKLDGGAKAGPAADAAAAVGGGQVAAAWLAAERLHGSAASHLAACLRAEPVIEAAAAVAGPAASVPEGAVRAPPPPPSGRAAKRKTDAAAAAEGGGGKRPRDAAPPPPPRTSPPPAYTEEHTLFVRGLPPGMDAAGLAALFTVEGTPAPTARVPPPRPDAQQGGTGPGGPPPVNRGIGYVQFGSEAALEAGLRLNGTAVDGGTLAVAKSRPPGAGGGRGGGGRGGGGGGRGGGRGRGDPSTTAFQPRSVPGFPRGPAHRRAVDVGGGPGARPPVPGGAGGSLLVPRTLVPRAVAGSSHGDGQPKTNADFRAMLFGGGKADDEKKAEGS